MSTDLVPFTFESHTIRTGGDPDNPWFVAKDVCDILGIVDAKSSVRLLDDDEKGVHTVPTLGGNQEMTIVYESGLYALVFKSRREEAKVFRKWVTSVVLPAIRKTGAYSVQPVKLPVYVERSLLANEMSKSLPAGHWCIFTQAWDILAFVELDLKLPVGKYDLLDGSIGKRWSDFRKGKPWAVESKTYTHIFPDNRNEQTARAYSNDELGKFNDWLRGVYVPAHLPTYLEYKKYPVTLEHKRQILAISHKPPEVH